MSKQLRNQFMDVSAVLLEASKTGMGMFCESYFLFAVGNMKSIWQVAYPTCFSAGEPTNSSDFCEDVNVSSLTYVEIAFVILGMLFFGTIGEDIGRKLHSRSTISLMLLGGILMTAASSPTNTSDLFIMFSVGLVILAIGVGGEYSAASSTSSEDAEVLWANKRGRSVGLTFTMQGWGNWTNTLVLFVLVVGLNTSGCVPHVDGPHTNTPDCQSGGLEWSWRGSYFIGLFFILCAMLYRFTLLDNSAVWIERQDEIEHLDKAEASKQRHNMNRTFFLDSFNFLRLVGCSLNWFLWDIVFYGNKLFQTTIIAVTLGKSPTLYDIYSATLINSTVALVGYYFMSLTIDYKWMGRRNMQAMGFVALLILFLVCGYEYNYLIKPENIAGFRAIYYLSSFFGQWGPNGTTFVLPAELFATDVRPFAHGISASWGKLGALVATIVFSLGAGGKALSVQEIFIVNGYVSLAGLALTILLTPDTMDVTLHEVDRLWKAKLEGTEYIGSALATSNLSLLERVWIVPQSVQAQSNEFVKSRPAPHHYGGEQDKPSELGKESEPGTPNDETAVTIV
ncbi:hypothetical protein BASA81_002537 [Batrachochytrium salamandrivorans]|nr:hypothetical protein BASA81_002537 [Batrachochytrium salamandrivorans]